MELRLEGGERSQDEGVIGETARDESADGG
jgi:hypothetical protein